MHDAPVVASIRSVAGAYIPYDRSRLEGVAQMASIRELFAEGLQITEIADNDEWGMDRNEGIGGSEAGSVLGLNKYHTALDLLAEKVTRKSLKVFSSDQQLRMNCGHALEALVLKTYAERELRLPYWVSLEQIDEADGLAHLTKTLFVNPRFPFAFAHIDGLSRRGMELGIVDAKVPFRPPWPEVPAYYVAQLGHYCAVIGPNVGEIAAMFQNHPYPEPRRYRFDFTSAQLKLVMKAEALFWKYVLKMRAGYEPKEGELEWLKETLSQMGEEFMSKLQTVSDPRAGETETVVVTGQDKELLKRFAVLKEEVKALGAEIEAISEYFKTSYDAASVSFVSEDKVELAKKSTFTRKDLDRDALAEAGVPVKEFYTEKPQTTFTPKKPLYRLAHATVDSGRIEPRIKPQAKLDEEPADLDFLADLDFTLVRQVSPEQTPEPRNVAS